MMTRRQAGAGIFASAAIAAAPSMHAAEECRLYASIDSGFIGQNVYLFCASEGLATVFRGAVDHAKLAHVLQLPEQQFVTFAQTVGYPAA